MYKCVDFGTGDNAKIKAQNDVNLNNNLRNLETDPVLPRPNSKFCGISP